MPCWLSFLQCLISGNPLELKALFQKIKFLSNEGAVFIAGGPIRDWLMGRSTNDIDLVVPKGAIAMARAFSSETGGAFVLLDEDEDVARVVLDGFSFDFSGFRKGALEIEQDLSHRDFTMNAMAVPLEEIAPKVAVVPPGLVVPKDVLTKYLIDPFDGQGDIERRIIKAVSLSNLQEDPLRMLRAFRFKAILDFSIHQRVLDLVKGKALLLKSCAAERINYELERIMATDQAGRVFKGLFEVGLLEVIIPEIRGLEGVEQPGFHHLDVLGHCLETISTMDILVGDPCSKFSSCAPIKQWLKANEHLIPYLKWAAFLHDFGKPSKKGMREDGRVTFYNHDKKGADMAVEISRRLRWSRTATLFVQTLVRMHMRPFHLLNDLRKGGPTKRAMRKLLEKIESAYPALFLLAMADSMAGCGPMKPKELDGQLSELFDRIQDFYLKRLVPASKAPPLVNGRDIMALFSIGPGPLVGEALRAVEAQRIEGVLKTRDEAIAWLKEHFPDELSVS